ncbi:hypothetical protein PG994_008139 [Apiospora phragmitis]|uniref:Uncharacterized protein n=1 Tax=Apiospora phragmitis TaxID=2905665 RepID=A0ABR1UV99_9PEZI
MDISPPYTVYPYADRAHAAISTVFRENLHLSKGLGAEGVNEDGEAVDCFGDVIDEPILEELCYKDEYFVQAMAVPGEDSDEEMEGGTASGNN